MNGEPDAVFDTLPEEPNEIPGLEKSKTEVYLLACLFERPDYVAHCVDVADLSPDAFVDFNNRAVYLEIVRLHRDGKPVDASTVGTSLLDSGRLQEAGGDCHLDLIRGEKFVDFYYPDYLGSLQKRQALRSFERLSQKVLEAAKTPGTNPRSLIDYVGQEIEKINRIGTKQRRLPEREKLTEFVVACPPRPPLLIDGLLHRGEKLVFGGASKSFKSWTALDMGLSIAAGADFWGHHTTQGPVLYINLELNNWSAKERIQTICTAKGIPLPEAFDLWNLRGTNARAEDLLADISDERWSLIIIDPIYKLLNGRDENAAGDIGSLMALLESLTVKTGAAIVFAAHFAKGNAAGKESLDRVSGSGVFIRDPDHIITLTKHEEPDCFTVEPTLRSMGSPEPFVVRWNYPLFDRVEGIDPKDIKQPGRKPKKATAIDVFNLLPERTGLTFDEWQAAASDRFGIGKTAFNERRTELVNRKAIFKSQIDSKWHRKEGLK